jgi:hypothetical protein
LRGHRRDPRAESVVAALARRELRPAVARLAEVPDHAGLRLITCGGAFDEETGDHQSNIIVSASLATVGWTWHARLPCRIGHYRRSPPQAKRRRGRLMSGSPTPLPRRRRPRTPIRTLLAAAHNRLQSGCSGPGEGWAEGPFAGTRSALPGSRCSRHPRRAVERLPGSSGRLGWGPRITPSQCAKGPQLNRHQSSPATYHEISAQAQVPPRERTCAAPVPRSARPATSRAHIKQDRDGAPGTSQVVAAPVDGVPVGRRIGPACSPRRGAHCCLRASAPSPEDGGPKAERRVSRKADQVVVATLSAATAYLISMLIRPLVLVARMRVDVRMDPESAYHGLPGHEERYVLRPPDSRVEGPSPATP